MKSGHLGTVIWHLPNTWVSRVCKWSTAVWSVTGEEHKRSRSEEGNQPSSPSSTEEPPTWISIGIWMVSKHYSQRHSIILIPTIALGGTLLILISFGWNPPAKFSLQWQWDARSANSKLVPRKSSRQTVQGQTAKEFWLSSADAQCPFIKVL